MANLQRRFINVPARALLALAGLFATGMLSGCLVAGVSSSGRFFLFPSLGVILVIAVLFALLRRR